MTERHSLAFRKFQIWADCERNGWDRTPLEVSESIGVTMRRVEQVAAEAGWANRFLKPRGQRAAMHKRGVSIDTNMLDVTELMRVGR